MAELSLSVADMQACHHTWMLYTVYIIYLFQNGVNTDSGQTVREAAFDGINEWVYIAYELNYGNTFITTVLSHEWCWDQ
jgi:hypothetical protein